MQPRLSRRSFLATAGGAALAGALLPDRSAQAATASPLSLLDGATAGDDPVAKIFNQALLLHTHWAEQEWDPSAGSYNPTFFWLVLGNAVLLKHGSYDASVAGISADELHAQTVSTIRVMAANNRLNGGTVWGKHEYFDSTSELYLELAARLLWDDLDSATQANIAQIITGQAAYTLSIGTGDDPLSPGWSTNGLAGGYMGDTKIDEMAVPAQILGPALAWYPDDANAAAWAHWLNVWLLNDTGLPPADQANPFEIDGTPISQWNTAQNIWDTFLVENHGSFSPCYQEETWRMSARVAAHFMLAGQPMPAAVTAKPNERQLWATMMQTMSTSGEPFMPTVDDRTHLFGRNLIPLVYLAQVRGNRYAARAEAMMASQLIPYLQFPPEYMLTKFSGQPTYEPEARAELGICYLFHLWRNASPQGPVQPVSEDEFYSAASGATNYGEGPGLLAQCTPKAFAATVTKAGFTKCVYAPEHDDWLFNVSGTVPSLIPSTSVNVSTQSSVAYNSLRDGFDGTASLLTLLTGSFTFPTVTARYVRMQGVTPATQFGYSIFEMSVYGPNSTNDLALHKTTTASSFDTVNNLTPQDATDGSLTTRWAVSIAERSNGASWIQVDLGSAVPISQCVIVWQAAYGKAYEIQVSTDGTTWTSVVTVPEPAGFQGFGYSGYATLPTGTAVYATSGNGAGEGALSVFNLDMPGVPGLNGQRTYTGSDGSVTIAASSPGVGAGSVTLTFNAVTGRYVRMQGIAAATVFGYSLYQFSVYAPGGTTDLALNQPTTASSFDAGNQNEGGPFPPQFATDGDPSTRWAVAVADRGNPAGWIQVDLGSSVQIGGVTLNWQAAYATAYEIQVSDDATTWSSVATVPQKRKFAGNWLNVDRRAGFVVSGSTNPITVTASQVTLSDGPAGGAAGMVVEAYASHSPAQTKAAAAHRRPSGGPAGLAASCADGYLSLFNLTGAATSQRAITIPQDGQLLLYRGNQSIVAAGTSYEVSLDAATAAVEPPRFTLSSGAALPAGLKVSVADSHHVTVTAPSGSSNVNATLTSSATGEQQPVTVKPGQAVTAVFGKGPLTPSQNLALGRTTFPTSPLPPTMSDPAFAVDGDPATTWTPGPGGRMVVDLGSKLDLGAVELTWHAGPVPAAQISVSADGLAYSSVGTTPGGPGQQSVTIGTPARYVAVAVPGWGTGSAELNEISVGAPA